MTHAASTTARPWYPAPRCGGAGRCDGPSVVSATYFYPMNMHDAKPLCEWHLRQLVRSPHVDEYCYGVVVGPLYGHPEWVPPYAPEEKVTLAGQGQNHRGWTLDELPDPDTWHVPEPAWSPVAPRKQRRDALLIPRFPRLVAGVSRWRWAALTAAVYIVIGAVIALAWVGVRLLAQWLVRG